MLSIFGDRDPRGRNSTAADGLYSVSPCAAGYPADHPVKYVCYCWVNMWDRFGLRADGIFGAYLLLFLASTEDVALRLGPAWSGVLGIASIRTSAS